MLLTSQYLGLRTGCELSICVEPVEMVINEMAAAVWCAVSRCSDDMGVVRRPSLNRSNKEIMMVVLELAKRVGDMFIFLENALYANCQYVFGKCGRWVVNYGKTEFQSPRFPRRMHFCTVHVVYTYIADATPHLRKIVVQNLAWVNLWTCMQTKCVWARHIAESLFSALLLVLRCSFCHLRDGINCLG